MSLKLSIPILKPACPTVAAFYVAINFQHNSESPLNFDHQEELQLEGHPQGSQHGNKLQADEPPHHPGGNLDLRSNSTRRRHFSFSPRHESLLKREIS
jgi:hypothetical protein